MKYKMYVDESGNTGEPRIRNGKWNFGEQPYFGLGSIMVREDKVQDINDSVINILHKYDSKLGTEHELKSQGKYIFRVELLQDLVNLLEQYECFSYFDISNKRFKVICYMVDYCFYPYYLIERLMHPAEFRNKRINAANMLYYEIDEKLIEEFDVLIRDNTEVLSKDAYISFLNRFREKISSIRNLKEPANDIERTIQFIEKNVNMPIENLIPVEDFNNKGNSTFFLPNIDALNNVVAQQAIMKLNKNDAIDIIHDQQTQFSDSLTEWIDFQKRSGLQVRLEAFTDSKTSAMLQVTDYILGTILRLFQKITARKPPLNSEDRGIIKILKPLVGSKVGVCNIVSVSNESQEFFGKFDLKTVRTKVPFALS